MRKDVWNLDRVIYEFNNLEDKEKFKLETPNLIENNRTKIKITCSCGYVFIPSISGFFISNSRCKRCSHNIWNEEKVIRQYESLTNKNNFILNIPYEIKNSKSKIKITCKICNYVWEPTVNAFFNKGAGCYRCNMGVRWTNESVIEKFNLTSDKKDYELILFENVTNVDSKIKIKCKLGHIWETTAARYIYRSHRCPICKLSKGERRIALFLDNYSIIYERQKKFTNCRNIHQLPFDFYLPNFGVLVEFNGQQHFKKMKFSKNDATNIEKLERTKLTDAIKRNWAISNGYTFLEIRYDEMDQIESKLMDLLNVYYI